MMNTFSPKISGSILPYWMASMLGGIALDLELIVLKFINDWCACADFCDEDGCADLPELEPDQDCCPEDPKNSQICGIYFDPCNNYPMATWDDAGVLAWSANIDNTDTTDKIKYLVGEGSIGDPEEVVIELPKGREKVTKYTYTMELVVKCLSDKNYNFLKAIQCGEKTVDNIRYETVGLRFFGGVDGVKIKSMKVKFPHGGGRDDVESATVTITWDACGEAPRLAVNPLAN